jgi:hypothetical protein
MNYVARFDPILEGYVRDFSALFLKPKAPLHRQYEALRQFYVDRESAKVVAARFGYTVFTFNSLRRDFAREPKASKFFRPVVRRPWSKKPTKESQLRGVIIELRKQNWSVYDIADELRRRGKRFHPSAIFRLLHAEGFRRLPRRLENERRRGP